jgi:membrane-bound ClpP family serine protease
MQRYPASAWLRAVFRVAWLTIPTIVVPLLLLVKLPKLVPNEKAHGIELRAIVGVAALLVYFYLGFRWLNRRGGPSDDSPNARARYRR